MKALLWVVAVAGTLFMAALSQFVTGLIVMALPWWASYTLIVFFAVGVAFAVMGPLQITRHRRSAAWAVIVLFLLIEAVVFAGYWSQWPWNERIVRLYTDLLCIAGCLAVIHNEP